MTTVLLLACYAMALLLAAAWLGRASWVQRAPKLGIAAWYLVSLGTVVAVLLVGIVLMISSVPWTANVAMMFRACTVAVREQYQFPAGELTALLGGFLVIAVAARLVYCLGAAHIAGARQRRRQRRFLGLVGRRDPVLEAVIVEHDVAAAYCVPGRGRNVVLTSAALANLDRDSGRRCGDALPLSDRP